MSDTTKSRTNGKAPFGRRLVVTIGPLEEWRGNAAGTVVEMVSDGTLNGLKATCSINKTIMGQPGPSTVTLWNLARDTRDAIRADLAKITVRAGWRNSEQHLLFQGAVMSAVSARNGTDVTTTIQAMPAYGAMVRSTTSQTFGKGMGVKDIVKSLASNLPGVTVDTSRITGVEGKVGGKGWSFAGATKDALTQLANEYGFSWSIQDGVFQAVGDKTVLGGSLIELNGDNGGLIGITPLLSGPMQDKNGVSIEALYVPGTEPGKRIRVKSGFTPNLSGEYRITKASYSLDAFSDSWTMSLEAHKGDW